MPEHILEASEGEYDPISILYKRGFIKSTNFFLSSIGILLTISLKH